MDTSNEGILAEANDALRAELAAQRTKARRSRATLLLVAYGCIVAVAVVASAVDVFTRGWSLLTMLSALIVVGWAGKELREVVTDEAVVPLDTFEDDDADGGDEEDGDEGDEGETTGVRVVAEDAPAESADGPRSGEHVAAKGGAA